MRLNMEDIQKIEGLLADHQAGMSRERMASKHRIRQETSISSFIGVLRKIGVRVPTSPNLRNGGKRILPRSN